MPLISLLLSEFPNKIINLFNIAIYKIVLKISNSLNFRNVSINTRILDFPIIEKIIYLKNIHINLLIKTVGFVKKVFNKKLIFCNKLIDNNNFRERETINNFYERSKRSNKINNKFTNPNNSAVFIQTILLSTNKFSSSFYENFNLIALLDKEYVDCFYISDVIAITGCLKVSNSLEKNSFNFDGLFKYYLDSNLIQIYTKEKNNTPFINNHSFFIKRFRFYSRIKTKIYNSITPSIIGHKMVKKTICFYILISKIDNKWLKSLDSPLSVMIIGDKYSGKTQYLEFLKNIYPNSFFIKGLIINKDSKNIIELLGNAKKLCYTIQHLIIDDFNLFIKNSRSIYNHEINNKNSNITTFFNNMIPSYQFLTTCLPKLGYYNSIEKLNYNINREISSLNVFDIVCINKNNFSMKFIEALCYSKTYHYESFKNKKKHDAYTTKSFAPIIPVLILKQYFNFINRVFLPSISKVNITIIMHLYRDLRKRDKLGLIKFYRFKFLYLMIKISIANAKLELNNTIKLKNILNSYQFILSNKLSTLPRRVQLKTLLKFEDLFDLKFIRKNFFENIVEEILIDNLTQKYSISNKDRRILILPIEYSLKE